MNWLGIYEDTIRNDLAELEMRCLDRRRINTIWKLCATNPITVSGYGTGNKPKFDRNNNDGYRVRLMTPWGWKLIGLEICNAKYGIYSFISREVYEKDYLYMEDLFIHDCDYYSGSDSSVSYGICFYIGDKEEHVTPVLSDFTLKNSVFERCTRGFAIGGHGESTTYNASYQMQNVLVDNILGYDMKWGTLFLSYITNLHKAMWTKEPMVHILPHWNWQDREGESLEVWCYSNCDEVELFMNDKSLGKKNNNIYEQTNWNVVYESGKLTAAAFLNGEISARDEVTTTNEPYGVMLEPDRKSPFADTEDAVAVKVFTFDKKGRTVPTASNKINFKIEGPGKIIGVGNGNPTCNEDDKAVERSLFNGLCQVIVQTEDEPGEIILTAESEGLQKGELKLNAQVAERRLFVPAKNNRLITMWRRSQIFEQKLQVNLELAENDMNSWEWIEVGNGIDPVFKAKPGYSIYRAKINRPSLFEECGLVFSGITGIAEIYINKKIQYTKKTPDNERVDLTIAFDGNDDFTISVIVDGRTQHAGITGVVVII